MKLLKTSAIGDRFKFARIAFVASALFLGASANAFVVVIPDGDFSTVADSGSINGGVIGNYTNRPVGTGVWSATGVGILGVIAAPSVTITNGSSGNATFTSLLTATVAFLPVNNTVTLFNNNIGTKFIAGQTYTFIAEVVSTNTLTVNLLSTSGFGIALSSSGTERVSSLGVASTISLLSANSARITVNYTAIPADVPNNIGVSLFAGKGSGLANVDLLGNLSFDNLTLTAVPEPSTWALWGGAAAMGVVIYHRRKTRVKNNS